jgi:hypothetical protein
MQGHQAQRNYFTEKVHVVQSILPGWLFILGLFSEIKAEYKRKGCYDLVIMIIADMNNGCLWTSL